MPHMIPNQFWSENNLYGEKQIFQLLSNSDNLGDYYIFHSLSIINHLHKREGEADFIILGPLGILDLEIKGAKKIVRSNGCWEYVNSKNSYKSIESPFAQAKNNIYSITTYLKIKKSLDLTKLQGYGVIFPNCTFQEKSSEWVDSMILDENCLNDIENYLLDLYKYWRLKSNLGDNILLSKDTIEIIKNYMRGDFNALENVANFIKRTNQIIQDLTEEQYSVLEALKYNNRLLIKGLPGTGKTLLAIEQIHRASKKYNKVLFLCFNRLLKANIYSQVRSFSNNIEVFTIDSLLFNSIHKNIKKRFSSIELFKQYVFENLEEIKKYLPIFDYVVIDEGQDILKDGYFEIINNIIKNNFISGCWSIFYDDEIQKMLYGSEELESILQRLQKMGSIYNLNVNFRNPDRIINRLGAITKLPITSINKIPSDEHSIQLEYYNNELDIVNSISNRLRYFIVEQKVKPNSITILFLENNFGIIKMLYEKTKLFIDNYINLSEYTGNIEKEGGDLIVKERMIPFCTVHSFKGLENNIIIIPSITQISSDQTKLLLYIGLTRTKVRTIIYFHQSIKSLLNDKL